MSTIPPGSVPPGSVPPGGQPPYDPKTQWRVYREQQKAAWRAQRDAWKAQRYAYRGYGGVYGPRVPSIVGPLILVAIGVIALLITWGRMDSHQFWEWYGKWWPVLLIAAGLGLLAEWMLDQRRQVPVRRGGGFVGILILLAFIGVGSGIANSHWDNWHHDGDDRDDFNSFFGRPQHDQDQQVLNTTVPANATIQIENPRGDVSISAGEGQNVEVQAHQIAYANSDSEAKKIFDAEKADVVVSGGTVIVKSPGHNDGQVNLTVTVPKNAAVNVEASHGDVTAAGLGAGATITASHGDVHLSNIAGSVQVHFSSNKGDFSAHEVTGDITADGKCNDLTLSEIKGKVTINGDVFGETHFENLTGGVHLHTSITDLQFGDLPGDLTLNDEDLHITEAHGGVRVTTHSKNIDLAQVSGDTYVDDRDGNITIEPAGVYGVEARNSHGHGDIELTLPSNASATVDGRTRNGDIVSDFPLAISGDDSKTASGKIGGGQAKVTLSTDVGDVRIKRGEQSQGSVPAPPKTPAMPKAPKTPKAPAEPVEQ
jgi:Putative adhesin/Domain of unknown function (DUF5668)